MGGGLGQQLFKDFFKKKSNTERYLNLITSQKEKGWLPLLDVKFLYAGKTVFYDRTHQYSANINGQCHSVQLNGK
jgi:hypothetical protein